MLLRPLATIACTALLATASYAQTPGNVPDHMSDMPAPSAKTLPSPPATAHVKLNGKAITVKYNSPAIKGRKVGGEVAPYGKVWRTGANTATTFNTASNLKIGDLNVPAGTYTIYTLPSADQWQLIINKQTGQWGTEYDESKDLGRVPMTSKTHPSSQERMSISFEDTKGSSTEMHVKWATTDEFVSVAAE